MEGRCGHRPPTNDNGRADVIRPLHYKEENMPELSNRTATFTDSVIRLMTRISNKYGAINLSQGFPDFEPPREILDRLAEVTREDFHQYSIMSTSKIDE